MEVALTDGLIDCGESTLTLSPEIIAGDISTAELLWSNDASSLEVSLGTGSHWLEITTDCGTQHIDFQISNSEDAKGLPVLLPTAFSPTHDGINDLLCPVVDPAVTLDYFEWQLYDRWGNRVFKTLDPQYCWSGQIEGQAAELGVYVWFYYARGTRCGLAFDIYEQGNVTLLR